ncbi:apolipoprotein N-acyltransferase [Fodinibius halophilus]|uniref:Apolipoprotein N-acyltransferase n=1 Tax=Fodinibius halophilus TaxID=1736908 RepID=A0A6M1T8S6_9BACT|nr:apolipoprotein N-acyltransferase [Fodinibius halophilus]NGP86782.1 apolipoprotein N-acyltransferase [Fodinibius halophilus]
MKSSLENFWNLKWSLILTAGILLGLSYPPVPMPFLVFPAFLLIFRLIDLSNSAREAAYWTYPAFLIWNIITTYWLVMATIGGGVAAILANSAVMTIPVILQYKVQQKDIAPWLIALFQTAFWMSFEYLHHHWDLAWPWLTIANAWSNVPDLVQYISITGFWGISFWVIFSTALAYQFIKKSDSTSLRIGIAAVLLFPLWSLGFVLFETETNPQTTQEVVVVQPNFDSYERYGGFSSSLKAQDHLLKITDSTRTDSTSVVVWPENAIQADIANIPSYSRTSNYTKGQLKRKADRWNASIISGATFYEFYSEAQKPPLPYKSEYGPFLPFNAALAFQPDSTVEVYKKHNLVPIVERVPFVHFLNAIDIFGWVDWAQNQSYGKGYQAKQFNVGVTKTPALICYDSVYPSWIRKYVQKDAGYLTIITNDGWWGNTSGHEQHFAYARLRAIEFDRWVVRSANNGISGIIAPDGSIKVETPYWQQTAFRYDVPVLTSQTFYTRFGDWLPYLMMTLSTIGIGITIINKDS